MGSVMYQLVPVDWVRRYRELEAFFNANNTTGSIGIGQIPQIKYENDEQILGDGESSTNALTNDFQDIENIFTKRMRSRARVILKYVQLAGGKMDKHKRLIYPNTGQIGSSLFELVQYTMVPMHFKLRKPQPIDFAEFAKLLKEAKAPSYIVALTTIPTNTTSASATAGSVERLWLNYAAS